MKLRKRWIIIPLSLLTAAWLLFVGPPAPMGVTLGLGRTVLNLSLSPGPAVVRVRERTT